MSNSLNFDDLSLIEIPVVIAGAKYVLREATGEVACKYRNALLASTKLGPDGKPIGIVGMADVEPLLVSLCLFSEDGRGIDAKAVRGWPSRIVKTLFAKAKEISGLDESEDLESLTKQRDELNTKIASLQQEDPVKNG